MFVNSSSLPSAGLITLSLFSVMFSMRTGRLLLAQLVAAAFFAFVIMRCGDDRGEETVEGGGEGEEEDADDMHADPFRFLSITA